MTRRSVYIILAVSVISLMVFAGLVLAVVLATRGGSGLALGGRIAVLRIDGVITDDAEVLEQIRDFRHDPSIKGYVVQINSPGGAVGPSQSIYQELRRIRDDENKPVVATIGGVGASGGYYLALAADSIYALPGSITGSIGVIMELPDASGLMEKVGVRVNVVESAEHKDVGSPFRPITAGDRQILGEVVNDVYRQFTEAVAQERKLAPAVVQQLSDGRIYSGRQALERGLIDRMGNFNDALSAAGRMSGLGSDPRIARPPKDEVTLLDVLLGGGIRGVVNRMVRPLETANMPRVKYLIPW